MHYSEKAKARFLEANPGVLRQLESIPDGRAEAVGTSKEKLRDLDLVNAMQEYAASRGEELREFMIDLGTDSEQEATRVRLAQAKKRAAAVGLTWEQYVELNPDWKDITNRCS